MTLKSSMTFLVLTLVVLTAGRPKHEERGCGTARDIREAETCSKESHGAVPKTKGRRKTGSDDLSLPRALPKLVKKKKKKANENSGSKKILSFFGFFLLFSGFSKGVGAEMKRERGGVRLLVCLCVVCVCVLSVSVRHERGLNC